MQALAAIGQDLRLACRQLHRGRRGMSAAAVFILTVGIAAATALFALVDGVLLRPLPVRDQRGLVVIWREPRTTGGTHLPFTATDIDTLRSSSRTLAGIAGVGWMGASQIAAVENGSASYLRVAHVTGAFFDVLGTPPLLGRALGPTDDLPGATRALVISHGAWQRRYGGARDVVGHRLTIAEQPFTIVGVMPPGLDYPRGAEAWTTVAALATTSANGTFRAAVASELDAVARLGGGITTAQATTELSTLLPGLQTPFGRPADLAPVLRGFESTVVGDTRATILVLSGAVVAFLLIASANVANLLLMRGESRRGEFALRSALGASRGRLAGHLIAESVVLASLAGALATAMAPWLVRAVVVLSPKDVPRTDAIAIDWRVLIFALATSAVAAAVAALAPVVGISREHLAPRLAAGARGTSGHALGRGRHALVVAQLALALTVVTATALLARSLIRLQAIDTGLDVRRLASISLAVPQSISTSRSRHLRLLDDLIAQLEASDAVSAVTPVNMPPFSGVGWQVPAFTAEGQDTVRAAGNAALDLEAVHPGYFETFGIVVARGRPFTPADREGSPAVAMVSEDVASRTWPGQDPIGKRLKMGRPDAAGPWLTVVGVVRATRYRELTAARPVLYVPAEQLIVAAQALVVRTAAPLRDAAQIIRDVVHRVDPSVYVMAVTPLDDLRQQPLARVRFATTLIGAFAAGATFLSAVGLFAMMAATVQQRGTELRVRMALGATPLDVQRLVLTEGLRLGAIGAAFGLAAATVTAQGLRGLLFEVTPFDATSLLTAGALLLMSSLAACAIPAVRASRADMSLLRE